MAPQSVTSPAQARKQRALIMLADVDVVRRGAFPWLWHVRSQKNTRTWYHVDTKQGTCNCPDAFARRNGVPCKHQQAVAIWELALEAAPAIAEQHDITLDQLETRLIQDLAGPVPKRMGSKLVVVLHATQTLISERQAADELSRTVELSIIPARHSPTHEELLAGMLVHGKPRDPGDWTPAAARARLAKAGYELVKSVGPGTTVRGREVYRKAA